ncbi:MAG TPA: Ig-like domain-containing protein, partial [Candidatus Ozemobacteraceae bacterium]|nr:Ig-like domain-containing protein [Candidatus Ozemobacteraceae bacterium]
DTVSNTITMTPVANLDFNQVYTVIASGLLDLVGNPQPQSLIATFTTQTAVPTLPVTINNLLLFADAAYSVPVASGATVLPGSTLYLEIDAADLAPATVDITRVVVTSPSGASVTVVLSETGLSTGIFHGSVALFDEENRVLQVYSETDTTKRKNVILPLKPVYVTLSPASASVDLPLDTTFVVQTNKPYAAASITSSTVHLIDSTGLLTPVITFNGPQEFRVAAPLATFSEVILRLESGILDTDGLGFAFLRASFTTLLPQLTTCTVFSDDGYTNVLSDGAKVLPGTTTVYVQAQGNDPRPSAVDIIALLVTDGVSTTTQTLTEDLPGRFRGSISIPNSSNAVIVLTPPLTPGLRRQLVTPPAFAVAAVSPASGAIEVPADSWPRWDFATPLDATQILTGRFTLTLLPATNANGVLELSPDRRTVTFRPDFHLALLKDYELRVNSAVKDEDGRTLGQDFVTRFVSQSPPPPPVSVLTLKNFADALFASESLFLGPESTMYLEVRAVDTSSASVDTTRVRVDSSDGTLVSLELTLLETGANTGLFRLAYPVVLAPGSTVRVVSQADADFEMNLQVRTRPTLVSVNPASGSVALTLDRRLALNFSRSMSAPTLQVGIEVVGSGGIPVGVTGSLQPDLRTWLLEPVAQWATGTLHTARLKNTIRDSDGVALATVAFRFTTRAIGPATFDLVTGLPPRDQERISVWHEAVPGPLRLIATTTSLFDGGLEQHPVRLIWSGGTVLATVTELATAPGLFFGQVDPGLARGVVATATLEYSNQPHQWFRIADLPVLFARSPSGVS